MNITTAYAFGKQIEALLGEVEKKVRTELAKEGFGVLAAL
jgi:uncharacterized protein (DUF302 family)